MSEAGRQALDAAIAGISPADVSAIISAPDEASRLTSKLMAAHLGGKVIIAPEFAEMGLGLWEGMRYEDLERRYCRAGRVFLENPCGVTAPEGEALLEYSGRVIKALNKTIGRYRVGSSVAIVLRPIALGVVRCALNSVDLGQVWSMVTDRPMGEWYELQRKDTRLASPLARHAAAETAAA